ncbi:MAG TPA: hypothetical protein DEH78_23575 [Solibacterales bacterium]|nr:hypothetical protein [Bryobacterales bacterium]
MKRLFGIALLGAITLFAAGPSAGVWKANLAKSKFDPGPAPKSITHTVSTDGDWEVLKIDRTDAKGTSSTTTNRWKWDGKEYPYKGSDNIPGVTITATRKGSVSESTFRRDGKVTLTVKTVLSADGKTRTSTQTGINPEGKAVKNVVVFEKQ